jgi:hypothetical protein
MMKHRPMGWRSAHGRVLAAKTKFPKRYGAELTLVQLRKTGIESSTAFPGKNYFLKVRLLCFPSTSTQMLCRVPILRIIMVDEGRASLSSIWSGLGG